MSAPIQFNAPEPSELSELLNGYEVTSLIAKGGMGAVYKATQISLDRPVAVKLLPEELCDPTFREQFQAEARAMAKLNHANLIGIFDYGEANGMPYIVMEFVAGKSLYYSSYEKAIDQTLAVEIVIGICHGLAAAHDSGIIHRDIKPANILLDANAKPKIGDFGLASPADAEGSEDGLIYGTPGYAAPEIFDNATAVGIPSDLYAVGVILYQLLTGKMPEEPASPPSTVSKCDARLDPIFRRSTRRNPAARFQTATEMAVELEKILPTLGAGGRRAIKTGSDRPAAGGVTLKRRLASDRSADQGAGDPSKPKLVALKKGESPPASRNKLTPMPEKSEGAEGDQATPAPAPPVIAIETGSNWPIIRNLLIIAALIPAIIFTWGLYEKKQADSKAKRDAEQLEQANEEIERKAQYKVEREAAAERESAAAAKRARRMQFEKKRAAEAEAEAAKTPLERLAEFRGNLYSGRRDQFPVGTLDRTTHSLFLVDQPMTWSEASQFAERHGGHLAVPSTQSEIDVLAKLMDGQTRRIWIGGGATGSSGWGWVNGDKWTYREPGTTLGSCAALTNSSVIKARPNAEKNTFVIQWSKDGSNLGSTAAQLERLVPTLDSPRPAWPPTTVAHQNRTFLLVYQPVSWDEADLIASSAEGHLAIVSKPLEGIFLRDYLKKALPPQQSAWLGGRLMKETWTWTSGEAWTEASWAPNSPDGDASHTALRYLNAPDEGGWDDATPEAGNAQGFLIEWSNDDAASTSSTKVAPTGNAELIKFREIARRFVQKEVREHEQMQIGNRDYCLGKMRAWYGLLSKNNQAPYEAALFALQENLPEDGDLSGEVNLGNLPPKALKIFEDSLRRQNLKQQALDTKLTNLRQNYLKKLLVMMDNYESSGLKTQVAAIQKEIEAIGQDGGSFRSYLGY